MASNDGQKLLVFGLSFAQHDNRRMQQVLRHYGRLPANPGSRAMLFFELNKIGRELVADEATRPEAELLTNWMKDGGDFPLGQPPANPSTAPGDTRWWERLESAGIGVGSHLTEQESNERYHNEWYGRGRTLDDPAEPVENTSTQAANVEQATTGAALVNGNATYEDDQNDDHDPEEDHEDGDEDDTTRGWRDNMWYQQSTSAFRGRGRTINDPPEQVASHVPAVQHHPGNSSVIDGHAFDHFNDAEMRLRYGQGRTINDPQLEESNGEDITSLDAGGSLAEINDANNTDQPLDVASSSSYYHTGEAVDNNHNPNTEADTEEEEIECPICACLLPPSAFPKRATITDSCTHPDMACIPCLRGSIAVVIERGALHLLACPICPAKLSPKDMKAYLAFGGTKNENSEDAIEAQRIYERYLKLKADSEIPGHWISCMSPTCGGRQPHDTTKTGHAKMICRHCGFATCAKHRRPWHEGQTCEEFDIDPEQIERLEEEEATARLLSSEAMSICPKCGQGVTKTEGCDHMQCKCGTEWCYIVSLYLHIASPTSSLFIILFT